MTTAWGGSVRFYLKLVCGALCLTEVACSVDSAKNHYVLAEKLWNDHKYAAAVVEFEKVIAKDPQGKLGQQAMFRAAATQSLFLSQYADAVRNLRSFIQVSSDSKMVWEAQLQIGEILFLKAEQYDQAILHYRALLNLSPQAPEAPEFLFRIGKSLFYRLQFAEALETYQTLIKTYPSSLWAERALFEIGETYFTRSEQQHEGKDHRSENYQEALVAYQKFMKRYPKSEWIPQARFGVASCLEELDHLDDAYSAYLALRGQYPSPSVIEIKLTRIRERMNQKSGSH